MFRAARIRIPVRIYMQQPPEATPATHRGAPSQHLAGTLPGRAWHQVRTYPDTWLEPYLCVHLSYTCLAASLNLTYSWLEPDLDVAGTRPGRHLSRDL